ncbi:MAG: hypothetical protein KF746_24625 [Chitinophagaceae bacterium]|nr:hypothetical protein [Chitinophagaceae bacterium]
MESPGYETFILPHVFRYSPVLPVPIDDHLHSSGRTTNVDLAKHEPWLISANNKPIYTRATNLPSYSLFLTPYPFLSYPTSSSLPVLL